MRLGCDPDQLGELAGALRQGSGALEAAGRRVDGQSKQLSWYGWDAQSFEDDLQDVVQLSMAATQMLSSAASILDQRARHQRRVSTAIQGLSDPGRGQSGADSSAAGNGSSNPSTSATDKYLQQALEAAGIDLNSWDPSKGVGADADTIEAVYEYYADLYRSDPNLQWAGMAALIGPSFYAGFQDLETFKKFAALAKALLASDAVISLPAPQVAALKALAAMSAGDLEQEFSYCERTFLQMQKEIFLDQATAHEAYRSGGLDGIRALAAEGHLDSKTVEAWEQIDEGIRTGDEELIQAGNKQLLWREQHDIIDSYYNAMNDRSVTGPAMTYLMTVVGEPSIPGAQGYADVFPMEFELDTPGPDRIGIPGFSVDNPLEGSVTVTTPLADGNIANFDDRWALIEQDTLPAYQELIENGPESAYEILESSPGDRADQLTIGERIDDIVVDVLTDWQFDFDQ